MDKDKLFIRVISWLFAVVVLWGLASVVLTITQHPSEPTTWRLIAAFATMFAGLLGLIAGYLRGHNGG